MTNFSSHWSKILNKDGTQAVDILASFSEKGINYFLERHHELDIKMYKKEFKKTFHTKNDKREFKINLSVTKAIQVQFPPFTSTFESNDIYSDNSNWQVLESDSLGPELIAPEKSSLKPNIRIYCNEINVKIEWPKISSSTERWSFKLNPFNVFGEAYLRLDKDDDGHFLSIIPTKLKLDIDPQLISSLIQNEIKNAPAEIQIELGECEAKFTDLFVIAANIALIEQTPKLVKNIKIPVPVIADRTVLPALLNLSDNIITAGFALDKYKIEKEFEEFVQKGINEFQYNLDQDIDSNGSLIQMVSSNYRSESSSFENVIFLSKEEIDSKLIKTNEYLKNLENRITEIQQEQEEPQILNEESFQVNEAFALGINEYFFDTIASSILPKPKHECTNWLKFYLAKGRACYWIKFKDPDIKISNTGSLQGNINIDIGGAIEGCIKKTLDCSWEWRCSSLSLAIKGRPTIKISLLNSSGIRIKAVFDKGSLSLVSNLPFPFNEVIKGVGSLILKTVEVIVNIILLGLSLVVLKPQYKLPQHVSKIKIRNLSQFYFVRERLSEQLVSKTKFVGYKGAIIVDK